MLMIPSGDSGSGVTASGSMALDAPCRIQWTPVSVAAYKRPLGENSRERICGLAALLLLLPPRHDTGS